MSLSPAGSAADHARARMGEHTSPHREEEDRRGKRARGRPANAEEECGLEDSRGKKIVVSNLTVWEHQTVDGYGVHQRGSDEKCYVCSVDDLKKGSVQGSECKAGEMAHAVRKLVFQRKIVTFDWQETKSDDQEVVRTITGRVVINAPDKKDVKKEEIKHWSVIDMPEDVKRSLLRGEPESEDIRRYGDVPKSVNRARDIVIAAINHITPKSSLAELLAYRA